MKRKAIEKIPYIGVQRTSRKKGAKYIGATAVKIIGNEKYLITEVYRNKSEDLAVPLIRIVLTEKDFGIFFVESGQWKRVQIAGGHYRKEYPLWDKSGDLYNTEKENVMRSDEDLQRIKSFPGIEGMWMRSQIWYEMIDERIHDISKKENRDRRRRRYERRQQGLQERAENTPELDEKKILDYADRAIFRGKHYLYYKKHGVMVRVACSKCGGVAEIRWKPGISYESQFERISEEPRGGYTGFCPLCGAQGVWKPQGKAANLYSETSHVFIGQKYKETGMIFRYIKVEKEYQLGLYVSEKGPVMENAREKISGVEIARAYFEEGKEIQIDYHKHNPYSGQDFWDDCNLYGMSNIRIEEAPIIRETYEEMKGTFLQYSAMMEYETAEGRYINPVEYAQCYMRTPQIEMLTKLGLIKAVESLIKCRYEINENANRVDEFLGIRKEHVRQLIRHQGEEGILKVMKREKQMDKHWSEEQIENLAELKLSGWPEWEELMEHMGIQKILNIIKRYAGAEYGTGCSRAILRLQNAAQTYIDYITMRKELGYDMSNTVYLQPRDLNAEHQKMAAEKNKEQANLRIKEADANYPLIKKHYRRLRRKFYYEDEDFCIRPARSAGEIVMEGRILHHCVGGDSYLKKCNDDITTILFLRLKNRPDVPYITVEIEPKDLNIIQWHGKSNKKPDEKNMDRWLKIYITKLKCGQIGAGQEAGEEATGQKTMIMPA